MNFNEHAQRTFEYHRRIALSSLAAQGYQETAETESLEVWKSEVGELPKGFFLSKRGDFLCLCYNGPGTDMVAALGGNLDDGIEVNRWNIGARLPPLSEETIHAITEDIRHIANTIADGMSNTRQDRENKKAGGDRNVLLGFVGSVANRFGTFNNWRGSL